MSDATPEKVIAPPAATVTVDASNPSTSSLVSPAISKTGVSSYFQIGHDDEPPIYMTSDNFYHMVRMKQMMINKADSAIVNRLMDELSDLDQRRNRLVDKMTAMVFLAPTESDEATIEKIMRDAGVIIGADGSFNRVQAIEKLEAALGKGSE